MKIELAFILTFYFITNYNILQVLCNSDNNVLLNIPIKTIPKDELVIVRQGLIFKRINPMVLINGNYDFFLRMNFEDFLNLKEKVMNITNERVRSLSSEDASHVKLLTNKIEGKSQEFIHSIFSNLEPESNLTRNKSLHESSFNSINHAYISQEITRLEQVDSHKNESFQFINILSNIASEMENDINNFESMFLYSIHTKTLTSSIISPNIFLDTLQKIMKQDWHFKTHSMFDDMKEGSEYDIYGLSQIAKIYYNNETRTLLFRIRIPLLNDIYDHAEYNVYEVIPVYTWLGLTENTTNASISNYTMVILDTKDEDKYLALNEDRSEYFTFNDISCRFINVKSKIFCHDSFLHIKRYENCIYSLYKGNGDNELCNYNVVQIKNPTKQFINLGEGRWFYSYSPRKADIIISQKCTMRAEQHNINYRRQIKLKPERGGVGLITFGANCHGSISGEKFVLKSINRKYNLYEFSNFPINISYVRNLKLGSHTINPREKCVGRECSTRKEVKSADDGVRLGMSILGVLLFLPLCVTSVYFYTKIRQLEKQEEKKINGNQNKERKSNTNIFQRNIGFHTPRAPPSPHPTMNTTNNFSLNPNPQSQTPTKSFNSLLNFDLPNSNDLNSIKRNDNIDFWNKNKTFMKSPSLIIDYFDKKRKQPSPATDPYHTYINNHTNQTSHTYANIGGNRNKVGGKGENKAENVTIVGDDKEEKEENYQEDIIYEDGDSFFENVEKYHKNIEQKDEEKEKSETAVIDCPASSSKVNSVSSLYVDMSLKSDNN